MKLTFDHLVLTTIALSGCSRKIFADEILITAPEGAEAAGNGEQWIIVFNDEDETLNGDGCEENMEKLVEEKFHQFSSAIAAKDKKKSEKIKQKMTKTIKAVAVDNVSEDTAKLFTKLPQVAYVEQNLVMAVDDTTWGIDRIDQRDLPLNNQFTPTGTGEGVAAYVIDTGIKIDHEEFGGAGGRARWGINTSDDGNDSDCHGHGTHVAGTVGGTVYGVAKEVEIIAVKVLACNGQGTTLGVIEGVEWVAQDAAAKGKPATANMSLGGGHSVALNNAVKALHNGGVPTVVAAGNSNADACAHSPASEDVVITVGSTASDDSRSSFSNYGSCVDIFAPGSGITAAWKGSTTAYNTISGTSMASPHVCGAAAILLGSGIDPSLIDEELTSRATQGLVTDEGDGSPNLLLYAGALGPTNEPTAAPPTAAPTPCTQSLFSITVVTDAYPGETSWTLTNDCTEEVVASREKYSVAGREETDEECVPAGEYTFTITDAWNDGMCCEYGTGSYKVTFDGDVKKEGGTYETSESIQFGSCPAAPTVAPTNPPTLSPTSKPTQAPTSKPTSVPTSKPTSNPTLVPTSNPTLVPTSKPTSAPIEDPTSAPTSSPIEDPTSAPTSSPIEDPTSAPTSSPIEDPTSAPTSSPIEDPTSAPTSTRIEDPTSAPTNDAKNWDVLFNDTFEDGKSAIFKKKKFKRDESAQHGQWVAWLGGNKNKKEISSRKQKFGDKYSDFRLELSYKCEGTGFNVNIICGTGNTYEFLKEFKKGTDFVENDQWINEVLEFSCPETKKLNIQFEGLTGKTYFDFVTLSGVALSLPNEEGSSESVIENPTEENPTEGDTSNPWGVLFYDAFLDGKSNILKENQSRFKLDNEKWVAWIGGQPGKKKNNLSTTKKKINLKYSDFRLEFSYKWKDGSEDFKVYVSYGDENGKTLLKEFTKGDNFEMNDQWIDEIIEFSHEKTKTLKFHIEGTGSGTYFDYIKLLAKSGSLPEEGSENGAIDDSPNGSDDGEIDDSPNGSDNGAIGDSPNESDNDEIDDSPNESDNGAIDDSPNESDNGDSHPEGPIGEEIFFEQFSDVDSTQFGDISSNLVTDIAYSAGGSYSITTKSLKSGWIINNSFSKFEVSFFMRREGLENDAGLRLGYKLGKKSFQIAREWDTSTDFDGNDKWVKASFIIERGSSKGKLRLSLKGYGSSPKNDIGIYIDDLKLTGIPS